MSVFDDVRRRLQEKVDAEIEAMLFDAGRAGGKTTFVHPRPHVPRPPATVRADLTGDKRPVPITVEYVPPDEVEVFDVSWVDGWARWAMAEDQT